MPSIEQILSLGHLQGALGVILIPAVTTLIDTILKILIDRKLFSPIWSAVKRTFKAWRTKRNTITADYEFSIYLNTELSGNSVRNVASDILDEVDKQSQGDFKIVEQKWSDDGKELDVGITYKEQKEPYILTLNFLPDSIPPDPDQAKGEQGSLIGSIGVNVTFQFEFGKLRNSIIDLMLFAQYLQKSITENLPTKSITDGRFIVSPINNELTLDDWIKKEQFNVSLLLKSEDSRSAVEFYSDKAIISSPHTEVDDQTVEYIRATLLNYYL